MVDTLPAGDGPVGIDASPDGTRVFVADWFNNRLLVFDGTDHRRIVRIDVGAAPAGVAVHPDGRTVYVAERDDDSVAVVDAGTSRAGEWPRAITRSRCCSTPRQPAVRVNVQSDDVTVIDTRSGARLATVKVGRAPYGAAVDAVAGCCT